MSDTSRRKDYRGLFNSAMLMRHKEPLKSTQMMREASTLAKEVGDLTMGLYIDHWTMQNLIHIHKDFSQVQDLAIQTAIEARKPMYQTQMERICVHEDLISTYMGIDPIGQSKLIQDAMDYMEQQVTPAVQCYYCFMEMRASFNLTVMTPEEATPSVQRYYQESEGFDHHFAIAHVLMCDLLYEKQAWERILPYAMRGVELIGNGQQLATSAATMLALMALALRKLGKDEAATIYQRAVHRAATIKGSQDLTYYAALCDYHVAGGEIQAAADLRERQLIELTGTGQPYWEAKIRLSYAQLLKQLGRPYAEQSALIRDLTAKLKKPEIILDPLTEFEAGA